MKKFLRSIEAKAEYPCEVVDCSLIIDEDTIPYGGIYMSNYLKIKIKTSHFIGFEKAVPQYYCLFSLIEVKGLKKDYIDYLAKLLVTSMSRSYNEGHTNTVESVHNIIKPFATLLEGNYNGLQ